MIRKIRSLCTRIMARIIPAMKRNARKTVAGSVTHRRLVVTVERESISMWVRGSSAGGERGVTAVTANTSVDRQLPSRSGPEQEPTATQAVNSTPRLGADPKLSKGGGKPS
jgi:hypothetical protein